MTDKRQELKERLLRAFEICDKHIVRIEEALGGLKSYFPLNEETYLNLNSEAVMRLDQFIFRFSKLQDAIGTKVFKYVLAWLYEEVETMSMRDVLDRLERLEVVISLNELLGSVASLKGVYERLKGKVLNDYELMR